MKTNSSLRISKPALFGIAIAMALMAPQAKAVSIAYDVGGSNFSFNADTVVNDTFSAVIDVPVGVPVIGTLQSGALNVISGPIGSTTFTLTETFKANGVSSSVALSGTLNLTAPVDILTYTNGSPTVIPLPGNQVLTITPLSLAPVNGDHLGVFPYTLQAKFALGIPDTGSTLGLLFVSVIGLFGLNRLRHVQLA